MGIFEDMSETRVDTVVYKDDGRYPNNALCPLLIYKQAVPADPAAIENLFSGNDWPAAWRNGIYPHPHYHSTAHEVLGVYSGQATVQFGGSKGSAHKVAAGDVVLIPAGVAHKCLDSTQDFGLVGAYPRGQKVDMNYGKDGERPGADRNIRDLPRPLSDPVQGQDGAVSRHWPES